MKATALTLELLLRGYLPNSLTPPFRIQNLDKAYPDVLKYLRSLRAKRGKKAKYPRAMTVRHSIPKRKLSRRIFSIPNPIHQVLVAREVARNWAALDKICASSSIALSRPVIGTVRALDVKMTRAEQVAQRAARSVGKRFVLTADFSRYYPSIYTHAIPWAIHGKAAARADITLFGNRLDERIRESQDKQTGGIPIGPDTSFLIGEVVAAAIDRRLEDKIGKLHGTRFVDDYYLYFDSHEAAERALAALHEIAASLELVVNDFKTEILPLPEALEPYWKRQLRVLNLNRQGSRQETQLIELFDQAAELTIRFPNDNVLTYAANIVGSTSIDASVWPICQSLLLRSALAEPSLLRRLPDIFEKNQAAGHDLAAASATVEQLCGYHSALQQGTEVMWAMWFSRSLHEPLTPSAIQAVGAVDDDLVALTTLHLKSEGLMPGLNVNLWAQYATKQHLFTDHWLVAYEGRAKGWLGSAGTDYTMQDNFFSILRKHGVSFYELAAAAVQQSSPYDGDADDEASAF